MACGSSRAVDDPAAHDGVRYRSVGSSRSGTQRKGGPSWRHSALSVALRQSYRVQQHLWMPTAASMDSICTGGTATASPAVHASARRRKITRFRTPPPHPPSHSGLTHQPDQPTQQIPVEDRKPQCSWRNSATPHHRVIQSIRQFVTLPNPPTLCDRQRPTGPSPESPVTSKIPKEAARSGAVTPPRAYHSLLQGPEDHG